VAAAVRLAACNFRFGKYLLMPALPKQWLRTSFLQLIISSTALIAAGS
jgi:hypothetical protein